MDRRYLVDRSFLVSLPCMSDISLSKLGKGLCDLLEFCCRWMIIVHLQEIENDLSKTLKVFETSW